ncbi:MAG: glycosyl hydrolase family 28 protein [Lentisphaeria bacterium]
MLNVREFGATGVAQQLCTTLIQQAIDQAAAMGGGTIVFPAGTYLTGTIYLKNNITLHLENGATLLGSPNPMDYNKDDFCPQNRVFAQERVSGAHLIVAVEVDHVGISGNGRIDGNRQAFSDQTSKEHPHIFAYPDWRPAQMLYFCECRNVSIENVQLYHAPYWTCLLHGCQDVNVSGVQIWNDQRTWNGDGLDIDCCNRVTVTNCNIDSGDDCITLRANAAPLKNSQRSCQHVCISNCILRTRCNAFRIGVGNGIVRDCVISNCIIRDTRTGICIIAKYSKASAGVTIENIQFDNLYIEAIRPLFIASDVHGSQPEPAKLIRNISFQHLRGRGSRSCLITGNPDRMIHDLTFSDLCFQYSGGADIVPPEKTVQSYGEFGSKAAPAAFYISNAEEVEFNRVQISWSELDGPWQAALMTENVSGLQIHHCRFAAPPNGVQQDSR